MFLGRGRSPSKVSLLAPDIGSEGVEFVEPPQLVDISQDPGRALHLAIAHSHPGVVEVLLNYKGKWVWPACEWVWSANGCGQLMGVAGGLLVAILLHQCLM